MPPARVLAVAPGSPAACAGVQPGDELVALNGEELRDVIRYQLQADEPDVELALRRDGSDRRVTIGKATGESLGLELHSAVFDRVQTCDNHCPFCFIHQLPRGMRRSLYLKDDDYRLSFLYGNFTTLTRFTEADLERVVTEGLGPLYVSIHATDPILRARLLRNRRGATSLRWLDALLAAGVEVHGQIVVCPGINDGAVLDDTLLGVFDRFPRLATLGVVPLGVSDHNHEPEMRPHTREEAVAVVECIERWQQRYVATLGRRLVYAADEYYLMAGRDFPPVAAYDGFPQHENGIGMARAFEHDARRAVVGEEVDGTGPRSGFFAWVDGAPADGYRAPRQTENEKMRHSRTESVRECRMSSPVTVITGEYGARVLTPVLDAIAVHDVRVLPVRNRFFGGNIGVTGLLTGADVAAALADEPAGSRYLLPDVVLSRDVFLDGVHVRDLPRPVEVVPTDGASFVRALAS